jgi:serine/threonine protein kinase, bacterial
VSFFKGEGYVPLVFGAGRWTYDSEHDLPCPAGGTTHTKTTGEFPLPAPPQDPITLLTGQGHQEDTGSKCVGGDLDDKFVRIGD